MRTWLVVCVGTSLVCACGGPGGPISSAELTPARLEAVGYEGELRPLTVKATISGTLSAPFVDLQDESGTFQRVEVEATFLGSSHSELQLTIPIAPGLPVGDHDGVATLTLCADAACQQPYRGATWPLPFHVRVLKGTNLTPLSRWLRVADWTNLGGNAAHTGYVPVTLDPGAFTRRWTLRWDQRPPCQPRQSEAFHALDCIGSPLIAWRGRVYLWGPDSWYPGWLYAYDERDGAVRWLNVGADRAPVLANGALLTSTLTSPGNASAMRLDAETGEMLVTASVPLGTGSTTPTVLGNAAYYPGSSINASDGSLRWTSTGESGDTPAVDTTSVYSVGLSSGILRVLDSATGAAQFSIPTSNPQYYPGHPGPPVLSALGLLIAVTGFDVEGIVGESYPHPTLVSFDVARRAEAWLVQGHFMSNPVTANGAVYVINGPAIEARDERTGALWWSVPLEGWELFSGYPDTRFPLRHEGYDLIVTDNVLFASTARRVIAIRLDTHEVAWSYPLGGQLSMSAQGVLYIVSQDPSADDRTAVVAINVK